MGSLKLEFEMVVGLHVGAGKGIRFLHSRGPDPAHQGSDHWPVTPVAPLSLFIFRYFSK